MLHGPGGHDEGVPAEGFDLDVEDVERMDGLDARDQVGFAHAVQGGHGEAAGVDFAAFLEQGLELLVVLLVAGKAVGANGREAAGVGGHQDGGTVQQDGGVPALAVEAGGGQLVDEADRAFEGDGVHGDEGVLVAFSLVVGPQLGTGIDVDDAVAFGDDGGLYECHSL